MTSVFVWWLVVQLVGLLALPLTYRVLRGLPDRGYAFARPLGLLLAGYIFWIAGSFGLLRNDLGGVMVALLAVAGLSLYFGRRELGLVPAREGDGPTLWRFIGDHKMLVIVTEVLFAAALGLMAWYRAFSPDIATAGGEKFMEYAFINAILRSPSLPPADPWLSGFAISYYHFGYLILSMLIRLSGLASSVAFTLSLALLFALTMTGAFSVVYNLVRLGQRRWGRGSSAGAFGFGLLGSLMLAVMGNLEGFFELLYSRAIGGARFWRWLDIRDLLTAPTAVTPFPPERFIWWWRASRVLQDYDQAGNSIEIIDEFPFFSFMLGDIHPHVLALPFAMLMLALALNVLADRKGDLYGRLKGLSPTLLLYAVCLGGMAFLNTWDFPTYLAVVALAFAARVYFERRGFDRAWWVDVLTASLTLAVLGVVLYLPFYIGFQSQAGGPVLSLQARTRLQQYLVMFGPFIFVIVSLLLAASLRAWREGRALARGRAGAFVIVGVGMALALGSLATGRWLALFLALLMTLAALHIWRLLQAPEQQDVGTLFAWLLLTLGLGLTFVVEFVYLKDTFGNRMNTIFKFYYQAWALMAIGAGYGVYYLWERIRSVGRYAFGAGFAALLMAGMIYPIFAAPDRAEGFNREPTLDGIAYTERYWPGDYAAAEWLKANVDGPAVVLEADGDSYSQYGRVSTMTGIPTLLGWHIHELQWRGSYEEPGRRAPEIQQAYQGTDIDQVQAILDKYDVTHVYVGRLEREKFGLTDAMINKFGLFMELVYQQDDVRIYQRRGV